MLVACGQTNEAPHSTENSLGALMSVHLFVALECMFFVFLTAGLLFFRQGQHGLAWFLTLLPFLSGAFWLVIFQLYPIALWVNTASALYQAMSVLAMMLVCAALLLYGCSLGSHRARIPMWPAAGCLVGHLRPYTSPVLHLVFFIDAGMLPGLPLLAHGGHCAVLRDHAALYGRARRKRVAAIVWPRVR
jgi:hypothetical protein